MKCYTADYLYTPEKWLSNYVLEVADSGEIIALRPRAEGDTPEYVAGILAPGFVNAHCHIELSCLAGKIPAGIGMTDFALAVGGLRRNISDEDATAAAAAALREAWHTGTVAIGDIANGMIAFQPKLDFPALYTHTFAEVLGLVEARAQQNVADCRALVAAHRAAGLAASLTLHAPYSVLPAIAQSVAAASDRLSIHYMESKAEKELLENGTGDFVSFFERINVLEHPFPLDKTYWEMLNFPVAPLLAVHNTQLSAAEIAAMPVNSYFCLCPISNEYLHQQQPDARLFLPYADRVCMGTDSLASNPSLAMDKEIQAIAAQLGGYIEGALHTALRWATTGGALALGINSRYGAFMVGQKPGINQLQIDGKWVRKLA